MNQNMILKLRRNLDTTMKMNIEILREKKIMDGSEISSTDFLGKFSS